MGWVEKIFQFNPLWRVKKKSNAIQLTWNGLDLGSDNFFLIIIIIIIIIITLSTKTTPLQTILNFNSASEFKPTREIRRRLK